MNEQLVNQRERVDTLDWIQGTFAVEPSYYEIQNSLSVPSASAQLPLFGRDWPMPVNFGALGVEVARQYTHAIDEQGEYMKSMA